MTVMGYNFTRVWYKGKSNDQMFCFDAQELLEPSLETILVGMPQSNHRE